MTSPTELHSHPSDLQPLIAALRSMMAAGGKLSPERALAETLNVKRHQLRRALHALRTNGELAPAEAKRKALVGPNGENLVRTTNPMEVIEMRVAIEPFLARLAALRASPFEMAGIERAATTAKGADTGATDLKFHKLIAASSGNKLASSIYSLLRQVASDARVRLGSNSPPCPKRTLERDAEHRAIAQAILRRDPDAAERAMRTHLAAVQKRVIEQLNPLTAAS
jgi:GntR family transcriptional regulator, transcriptional repressor for pyruvate dehydrogenase complex